jgi:hypothetical protein
MTKKHEKHYNLIKENLHKFSVSHRFGSDEFTKMIIIFEDYHKF